MLLTMTLLTTEMPMSGPGRGGRVGISTQQHVIKSLSKDTTRGNFRSQKANISRFGTHNRFADEDPREALLKYAAVAEDDPMWVGKGEDSATGVGILKISNSTTFSFLCSISKNTTQGRV